MRPQSPSVQGCRKHTHTHSVKQAGQRSRGPRDVIARRQEAERHLLVAGGGGGGVLASGRVLALLTRSAGGTRVQHQGRCFINESHLNVEDRKHE